MTLREVPAEIGKLLAEYNGEETTDDRRLELEKLLDGLDETIERKADAIASMILGLEGSAEIMKWEVDRLGRLKKQRESEAERLRRYLGNCLQLLKLQKLNTRYYNFSFRTGETVILRNDALIPAQYCVEVPAQLQPDKTLIKNALKSGFEIDGAWLDIKQHLQIR